MNENGEVHFSGKVAQKAIIVRDEEILLARDVRDVSTWELPGGRLNVDEDPKAGLARELFEELGCHCDIGNIAYVEQFFHQREQNNTLLLVYEAAFKQTDMLFRLAPDEVAEVRWVHYSRLHELHIFDNCLRALTHYINQHH